MPRPQALICPAELRDICVTALTAYIDIGFPEDGTDCAQVAREALRDATRELQQDGPAPGTYHYNRRIRAFLKEALKHHYAHGHANELALLLAACDGTPVSDVELAAARMADQAQG